MTEVRVPSRALPRALTHALGLALLALALAGPRPVRASDDDHDRARDAVLAGQVLPLRKVLEQLERDYPGHQVLEVELEEKHGRWVYEIKLLQDKGRLLKLYLDARDGKPLARR